MSVHATGEPRGRRLALRAFAAAALGATGALQSAAAHDQHHHHHATPKAGATRTTAAYRVPDVKLVDVNGTIVPLRARFEGETKPVILNFIYTTCGAICPVMSATFAQVQAELGAEREGVRMVSISIDPEQDTPAVLKAYARRFEAGSQWLMLTGSSADSVAVQRAFDAYRGDKMSHQPATFLRAAPGQPWVRLDGFASASEIVRELRSLRAH
jgi:protein SCO1